MTFLMGNRQSIDQFVLKLKRKQIVGEQAIALQTIDFLRNFISLQECSSPATLLEIVSEVSRELVRAQPFEFLIANIARRVLHLIREEFRGNSSSIPLSEGPADSFMYNMLANPSRRSSQTSESSVSPRKQLFELVQGILQGIDELREEIATSRANIAAQALEHIHSNEIIMTFGRSETVEQFLLAAGRKRQFQVIIAEAAPKCSGHVMAKNLASAGISTLLIPDASIFAMMARVNKVILGCHSITANGGMIGLSGSLIVTSAAKHHSTPVIVLAAMYKLSPVFPENYDSLNVLVNPEFVFPSADASSSEIEVLNPLCDLVQPQSVSLIITNAGGHPPSYVYRLLGEMYDPEDNRTLDIQHLSQ